jgi:hypothetical protein
LRYRVVGVYLKAVKLQPPVNRDRNGPTNDKESDDDIAKRSEIVVELTHQAPKSAFQVELFRHEAEEFYAADREGNNDRN